MKKIGCILMLSVLTLSALAQKESNDVRAGNKLYKSSKFTDAEVAYRKGLQKNSKSFEANYNLGNALFKQKKYKEALEKYNNAIALKSTDKHKIASTLHNVGNSLFVEKKYEESINAYKAALKNNPKDDDTRYNLAYAQLMLKKQQEEQKKDQKDQNKDQNKNQNKQDQKQNKDQQKEQPQPQQQNKPQMSKENAQQILDALMQDEKNTQDKAKKTQVRGTKKAEKDW